VCPVLGKFRLGTHKLPPFLFGENYFGAMSKKFYIFLPAYTLVCGGGIILIVVLTGRLACIFCGRDVF
jgi:hypothetical protein